jgi:hypothetical protein
VTIIRFRQQHAWMHCNLCGATVPHLRAGEAAAVLGLSEKMIVRLAETGDVHSVESCEGVLLLCGISLMELNELKSLQASKQ